MSLLNLFKSKNKTCCYESTNPGKTKNFIKHVISPEEFLGIDEDAIVSDYPTDGTA